MSTEGEANPLSVGVELSGSYGTTSEPGKRRNRNTSGFPCWVPLQIPDTRRNGYTYETNNAENHAAEHAQESLVVTKDGQELLSVVHFVTSSLYL